jgi:hypothetical protein
MKAVLVECRKSGKIVRKKLAKPLVKFTRFLALYPLNVLKYNDNESSVLFYAFKSVCYLSPFLEAIIADDVLGKFM